MKHKPRSNEQLSRLSFFLATAGWQWCCQPFSCLCSQNVTHRRRRFVQHDGHVGLRNPCLLSKSKDPIPNRSLRSRRAAARSISSAWCCIMLAKDRIEVSKIGITGYWLWSRLSDICDCCKSMKNFRDSAFTNSGLEVGLPAFQLPMFEKCDSLPKGDLCDMFVSGIHAFCEISASIPYQKLEVPESQSTGTLHLCINASRPSLCCSCGKKTCLMQRSRGFGHGVVVSKNCTILIVLLCDCCKPMNNCRDWALSNSGLEVGLPAFQLPTFENFTQCRKEICSTCLCKESIPTIPFGNSKHPLPTRSRFLRAAVRSTSSALCLHHAHPFVAAEEKKQSHAEKQRVWSRSCRDQNLLRAIQRLILSKIWATGYWLCSQVWHVTSANQWTIVEIEFLATASWKWGCQPFTCPCSKSVTHCRKEIGSRCLFKESMPFVKSSEI